MNDQLGDCTCAAAYHAMQLWSVHGRLGELTEPDAKVSAMYQEFCGYNPADPSTDQGGVEQDILARWLRIGVPIIEGPNGRSRLHAYFEVDPRNHDDVKSSIANCGLVYIGFNVPAFLTDGPMPMRWDWTGAGDATIEGGHAVIAPGYDAAKLNIVSWGSGAYEMTWSFWDKFVDECYVLSHPWWVASTGLTPLGMTRAQMEAAMAAFR